jgi:hypothetical protein
MSKKFGCALSIEKYGIYFFQHLGVLLKQPPYKPLMQLLYFLYKVYVFDQQINIKFRTHS